MRNFCQNILLLVVIALFSQVGNALSVKVEGWNSDKEIVIKEYNGENIDLAPYFMRVHRLEISKIDSMIIFENFLQKNNMILFQLDKIVAREETSDIIHQFLAKNNLCYSCSGEFFSFTDFNISMIKYKSTIAEYLNPSEKVKLDEYRSKLK